MNTTPETTSATGHSADHARDAVVGDSALDALLKMQDDLRASMGTDLDGTEFKDEEIAWLLVLSASVTHLVHDLRAARAALASAAALLSEYSDRVSGTRIVGDDDALPALAFDTLEAIRAALPASSPTEAELMDSFAEFG